MTSLVSWCARIVNQNKWPTLLHDRADVTVGYVHWINICFICNYLPLRRPLIGTIKLLLLLLLLYIKRHFFKKNILKSFLHGCSSNQHIVRKPLSEMYTSHFEHVWSSTFQQQQQKPTDLQPYYQVSFIKTFYLYQVVSFARLITGYKKICMSWEYFLGDRN